MILNMSYIILVLRWNNVKMGFLFVKVSMPKIIWINLRCWTKSAHTLTVTILKWRKEKFVKLVDSTYIESLNSNLCNLIATRPNILYRVSFLSQYMVTHTQVHLQGKKKNLTYIRGTLFDNIFYSFVNDVILVGYSNNDWDADVD